MKNKNRALLSSVLSLILCISMLLGTTFAWFTDEVTSTGNIIKSGTLDATMEWKNPGETEWKDASTGAIFDYAYWEPGYTELKFVKVENKGDLAFKFRLDVIPATPAAAGDINLADVIDVYMVEVADPANLPTVDRAAIAAMTPVGTLSQLMMDADGAAYGIMLPTTGSSNVELKAADEAIAKTGTITYGIALKMQETAGNDYMNKTVGGQFSVRLLAAQYTYEGDSFGTDYDTTAQYPGVIDYTVSKPVTTNDAGEVAEATAIGNEGEINAAVPAGVKLAEGATELQLSVKTMSDSEANLQLENGESKQSLDIHVAGVSEDNTVPMTITLPGLLKKGLNTTSVAMYHVEDGVTVAMTLVNNPVNHNEFSYDPATGDVVISTATYSEYVPVTYDWNLWKGEFDTDWYNTTDTEFTLFNADELAGFGKLVDEGNTFAGKTVKLGANIDLNGGYSLNPIGCGYAPETGVSNANDVTGAPFMGTFDGGIYDANGQLTGSYTISNLYQNGWELGLEYCNLGGGLFASIANGTVKNLVISGADIKMECVEQGVLVGLSQGECTYENIKIYNSKVANYQRATGGLIGEVSPFDSSKEEVTTITNVTIGADVVVGSMWGDFDAPVGGVIGARWDDGDTTKIEMNNVNVAAKLDVYNDVTSTYQWYAYRRAGMLIGNTERTVADNDHLAAAGFLKCTDVTVEYGSWVDYHYCEFNNHNPSWPWVRVEVGENCTAYSNPRYGVPNDPVTGKPVTSLDHDHSGDDEHNVPLPFNQLYGGGQGVYGAETHPGVKIIRYKYKITYVNNNGVLAVTYVPDNSATFSTKNDTAAEAAVKSVGQKYVFSHWMNAGSTKVESIPAGNTENIVLHPAFTNLYTATFVDQEGNVLAQETFTNRNGANVKNKAASVTPPTIPSFEFSYWEVRVTKNNSETKTDLAKYGFADQVNITIYPVYTYSGNLKLTPVDNEPKDGIVDYYQVDATGNLDSNVWIPGDVNGIPVAVITDLAQGYAGGVQTIIIEDGVETINANAFAWTPALKEVTIPASVTSIGANTFANTYGGSIVQKTITITYAGTWEQYRAACAEDWERGLATGTKVICSDGTATLKATEYWLYWDYDWTFVPN